MKKNTFAIILAFLAITAHAQNDSTSFGGVSANMNSNQSKPRTYNSTYSAGPLAIANPTSATRYNYASCPSGFNYKGSSQYPATQQTTTNYILNGQVVGTRTSAPVDTGIDCTRTESQTLSCSPGYQGAIRQNRDVAGSEGDYQYNPWITTSNTCTPIPPVITTDYQTLSCGAGYTGSISQSRTRSTAWNGVATYGGWNTTSNSCTPIPPTVATEYQTLSCGSGYTGSISQQRSRTTTWNGSVSYSSWITTSNSCTLSITYSYTTEYQSLGCSGGQTGSISQSRTRTNGSDGSVSYTGWSTYSNTCTTPSAPSGCSWAYGTASIGTNTNPCNLGNPGPYPAGESYRCTSSGWVQTSPGNSNRSVYCD